MPITTKVVSLNPVHGEVYYIQHYVIKFVSSMIFSGCSTNKTDHHDIAEILLTVALNSHKGYEVVHLQFFYFWGFSKQNRGSSGLNRMVVRFTTICAISAYHH